MVKTTNQIFIYKYIIIYIIIYKLYIYTKVRPPGIHWFVIPSRYCWDSKVWKVFPNPPTRPEHLRPTAVVQSKDWTASTTDLGIYGLKTRGNSLIPSICCKRMCVSEKWRGTLIGAELHNVLNPIINLPYGDSLHHPFLEKYFTDGMVMLYLLGCNPCRCWVPWFEENNIDMIKLS